MSEKLCVFCDHFGWNRFDYTYYSTLTGGSLDGGAGCMKGHYYDRNPDDAEDFRALIQTAIKCPDYSPPTTPK